MINLSIIRHAVALLTLVLMVGSVFSGSLSGPVIGQPVAAAASDLFKNRIEGCNTAAPTVDFRQVAGDERVAARNNSPMCTYLEKCCAGNTDNGPKCCAGLVKNGC